MHLYNFVSDNNGRYLESAEQCDSVYDTKWYKYSELNECLLISHTINESMTILTPSTPRTTTQLSASRGSRSSNAIKYNQIRTKSQSMRYCAMAPTVISRIWVIWVAAKRPSCLDLAPGITAVAAAKAGMGSCGTCGAMHIKRMRIFFRSFT